MIKTGNGLKIFLLLLLTLGGTTRLFSQANITVTVTSVQVTNNVDCDGFLTGDSDFVFEYLATDNTLGYSNNNPVLFGFLGDFNHAYVNGNNGPWTRNAPSGDINPNDGEFFDHDYSCPNDVPTQITIDWQGYENDAPTNYDLTGGTFSQVRTNAQNGVIAVPASTGTTSQTFTASGTSGCGTQNYSITIEVTRTDFMTTELPDDICSAPELNLNTTYTFTWCPSTLEPNEPHRGDVTNFGSVWFKFVAPAGGEVEVTTDLGGTDFGTYFEIYHAADGIDCTDGTHPINGLIKDKFEYLSHYEFSDGTDLLGIDPEAEITLAACDPVNPISYQKLVAGETYYVQFTSDDADDRGDYQVRVNDLGGGSPGNIEDLPCTSPWIPFGTTAISSGAASPPSINLDFGCAYDGGNDFGEVGEQHTSNDPNEYHAYDYDHNAVNNGTLNESVWFHFTAPNQGRIVFETDYQSGVYSEDAAFFGYDKRFAPGVPADYRCSNLENIDAAEGGLNGFLGGATESAIIMQQCLEPGYDYYAMVDPANSLTALSAQNIDAWIYDPSVTDPIDNPPGNDILCLTMMDPLYEVVVTPAGVTPSFQAVAGDNERGCTEYLAGEPPVDPTPGNRADQTVWHYFTVPPSGAVEMNIRAYIGMDTLRYAVYELLNGTDCYGGLNPATFTIDGTQTTPVITPVLTGSAGFDGTQESICCLTPGTVYAIQIDGGSPGDEGQYIIEYIREVESYAGDTYVELANSAVVDLNSTDTAFVCYGDTLTPGNLMNGSFPTLDIPSCLTPGFVMHSTLPIPDPVSGSGFAYIDTVQGLNSPFVNDSDGSGAFGNPSYNTVYYVSSMADEPATWGDFSCNSSTVDNAVQVIFLQPIVSVSSYDAALCEITFTSSGGYAAFYGGDFNYTIEDGSMNLVATGTFASGVNVTWPVPSADVFTITIDDGNCPYSFTVDASACANPCIVNPNINFVNATICEGQSIFLEGANQTIPGLYTDVFTGANGCDSTIYTTLTVNEPSLFEQTVTICQGSSYTPVTNTYNTSGVYMDTLLAANGCDSIVTTNLFVESTLYSSMSETICFGTDYSFGGNTLTTSGTYVDTVLAAAGCDSVVTLHLIVRPEIVGSISATICEGDSYTIGTQTQSTSGTYVETFTSYSGCDSLVTLYLFVNPTIENNMGITICEGQSYTLGGQVLTTSGQYSEMFVTPSGCDSLVTVFLNVSEALDTTLVEDICLGDSYLFGSQSLTTSGIYVENFPNAGGCDSLVTLELTVLDCEALLEISNICTPNDDGKNDTWKVSDLNQIDGCTVQIFNRWGQKLYETDNYQNEWDGTHEGNILPDATYYYVITCEEERMYQGAINLMRFKK
jgi:gliding motility-associated-like protein